MSSQALTKRYSALGGTRTPLTGQTGAVTPPGTVVRYWMARSEADVRRDHAVEVALRYNGSSTGPRSRPASAATPAAPCTSEIYRTGHGHQRPGLPHGRQHPPHRRLAPRRSTSRTGSLITGFDAGMLVP